MALHGWYRLRIVSVDHPDPGPGGMYLTLDPDGKVTVAAQGPHTHDAQRWHIEAVNGGTNVYVIGKSDTPPEGLREGLLEDTNEVIVEFGPDPEEWRINLVEGQVYLISPNKNFPIGVEHLLATDGDKVVVKTFPVIPGDRPAWELIAEE